jgi:hypothetical protein
LFPKNENFRFIPTETCAPHGEDVIHSDVTHKDILKAGECNNSSATGNSGISFEHIKKVAHSQECVAGFEYLINTLLKNPAVIDQIPKFYEVKVVLIPKSENKVRPIQITETILRLAHKAILNKLPPGEENNEQVVNHQFSNTQQSREL